MSKFEIHTIESAPGESADALRALEQGLGFVPNLAATMAESPELACGFVEMRGRLGGGDLTPVEREIVALATSLENDCDYCMAAHSTFALMQGADEAAVAAARRGEAPADPKLCALYRFARALVAQRGHVDEDGVQDLLDAGYSRAEVLEVVGQASFTTIANLTHNVSGAPLDEAFQPQSWTPGGVAASS